MHRTSLPPYSPKETHHSYQSFPLDCVSIAFRSSVSLVGSCNSTKLALTAYQPHLPHTLTLGLQKRWIRELHIFPHFRASREEKFHAWLSTQATVHVCFSSRPQPSPSSVHITIKGTDVRLMLTHRQDRLSKRLPARVCCINHCLQNILTKHSEHVTQNERSKHIHFLLFCSMNDLNYLWPSGGFKKKKSLSDVQYATDASIHHYTELMLVKFPFFSKSEVGAGRKKKKKQLSFISQVWWQGERLPRGVRVCSEDYILRALL